MCLIAIAHCASAAFPLIIAANRDEDYERPSIAADFWSDEPDVVGGRDLLHGGSWLAITRRGRYAAVTNIHGSRKDPQSRSRGEIVSAFVTGRTPAVEYSNGIAARASQYAGFYFAAGLIGTSLISVAPPAVTDLPAGIHALSNAAPGEHWPKVDSAVGAVRGVIAETSAGPIMTRLLAFLGKRIGPGSPENEVFLAGERYGTRASTVIVAGGGEVYFAEQTYASGGIPAGAPRVIRFHLETT